MGDVVGYALIDRDAKTGVGPNIKSFLGEQVRVMEFARDGGVLVLNREATAMAMFDKCDVVRSFKCGEVAGVITPPDLNTFDQMIYVAKASTRKDTGCLSVWMRYMHGEQKPAGVYTITTTKPKTKYLPGAA